MKNETKKKIVAVAAGFSLVTLIATFALVLIDHPAQWALGFVTLFFMSVGLFVACTINQD